MRLHGCYFSKNSRSILGKLHTGAAWHDIPQKLCPWQTAYNRFNRWASIEVAIDLNPVIKAIEFWQSQEKIKKNIFTADPLNRLIELKDQIISR